MARVTADVITYAMEHSSTASRDSPAPKEKLTFDPFLKFASNVVHRSEVRISAIMVSLVYIERARHHLFVQAPEWACERVFLGALILANKVGIFDFIPLRGHWKWTYPRESVVHQRLVDQESPMGPGFWGIR